jgi:aspartyl-tRNA(Asn)/glutamyl-tRNA(Gln) amidotransferase subunit B
MTYEPIIGLEVHAQLSTRSKIFCRCSTEFGAEPNTLTCPVCLGMPGVLPVLNKQVVELAMVMAIATHCSIAPVSRFARKNYFYPDLPKGYQISQYEMPMAENGWIIVEVDGSLKKIRVRRIHMEEDAGKSFHEPERSLLDFNRCGIPLIEIVSEPDIRSTDEAVAYLKKLRTMLRYLEICDGNMEEGSLRCDANLSLRVKGEKGFGTRTELKNMNSFRGVHRALDYEIKRQRAVMESRGRVVRETRLWNESEEKTMPMRSKEESSDYRYFPEPDLPPIVISKEWVNRIEKSLPELPDQKKKRFIEDYGLSAYDAGILTGSRCLADYYESCQAKAGDSKLAANWIINDLLRELKKDEREIEECPVTPDNMAAIISMIRSGKISGKMAKEVFDGMYKTGADARQFAKTLGEQITDEDEIAEIVKGILEENSVQAEQYRAGKDKLFDFFVGQVMKKTRGKANPKLVGRILKRELAE